MLKILNIIANHSACKKSMAQQSKFIVLLWLGAFNEKNIAPTSYSTLPRKLKTENGGLD